MSVSFKEKRGRFWSGGRIFKRLKYSSQVQVHFFNFGSTSPNCVFAANLIDMSVGVGLHNMDRFIESTEGKLLIENSKQDVTSFFLPPSIFPRVLNLL